MIYLTCPKNKKFTIDIDKLFRYNIERQQVNSVRVISIYGEGEAPIINNKKFEIIPNTISDDIQIFNVEVDCDMGDDMVDTIYETIVLFPEIDKADKIYLKHSGYENK